MYIFKIFKPKCPLCNMYLNAVNALATPVPRSSILSIISPNRVSSYWINKIQFGPIIVQVFFFSYSFYPLVFFAFGCSVIIPTNRLTVLKLARMTYKKILGHCADQRRYFNFKIITKCIPLFNGKMKYVSHRDTSI